MSKAKLVLVCCAILTMFAVPRSLKPQNARGPLAVAQSVKCVFPLMVVATWTDKGPDVKTKTINKEMRFDKINTEEGTAELQGDYGKYDIIVRYADGYLHFIQSFLNGPLYTTTVLEKKTASGKLKAMHSRHEYIDFALVGITSSPEQYYGECEILR